MSSEAEDPSRAQHAEAKLWRSGPQFYAEFKHPSSESPVRVVLHGITNQEQAAKALSMLNQSRVSRGLRA